MKYFKLHLFLYITRHVLKLEKSSTLLRFSWYHFCGFPTYFDLEANGPSKGFIVFLQQTMSKTLYLISFDAAIKQKDLLTNDIGYFIKRDDAVINGNVQINTSEPHLKAE